MKDLADHYYTAISDDIIHCKNGLKKKELSYLLLIFAISLSDLLKDM